MDDSLDLLANTSHFSSLDLASGYWQVAMVPESRQKTAFCSHSGHYEFTVMPFGLCNVPATFQRLMETVLAGLAREKCIVYLDDILVIGGSFEEHMKNLCEVCGVGSATLQALLVWSYLSSLYRSHGIEVFVEHPTPFR